MEDRSVFLDLVQQEFRSRRSEWQQASPTSYCARFAGLQDDLLMSVYRLIEVEQYLGGQPDLLRASGEVDWPSPGSNFDEFIVVEELGRGAVGRAYLCRQPALGDRLVVLKVGGAIQAEASRLGALNHPNVVTVYATGVDSARGVAWVCMPYHGRQTLTGWIANAFRRGANGNDLRVKSDELGRPSCRRRHEGAVIQLFSGVARGMAYIHSQGLVHGDIKPSNILVSDEGAPLLIDFNLARRSQEKSQLIGGTIPYMAPEQLAALVDSSGVVACETSLATETFSFGAALCEALLGAPLSPLHLPGGSLRDAAEATLRSQQRGIEQAIDALRHRHPKLVGFVRDCTAASADERPRDFTEIAARLQAMGSRRGRAKWWMRQRPIRSAAMAVCLALLAGVALAYLPTAYRTLSLARATYHAWSDDHPAAWRILSSYVEERPYDVDARRLLARSLLKLGKPHEAATHFAESARISADSLDAAWAGYSENLTGDHLSAIAFYESARRSDLQSVSVDHNYAASLVIQLAIEFDSDLSESAEQLLLACYRSKPDDLTIRHTMLTHFRLVAGRETATLPDYPIGLAEIRDAQPVTALHCSNALRYLVQLDLHPMETRRLSRPLLKRLISLQGLEEARYRLGPQLWRQLKPLVPADALVATTRAPGPSPPPRFLEPEKKNKLVTETSQAND